MVRLRRRRFLSGLAASGGLSAAPILWPRPVSAGIGGKPSQRPTVLRVVERPLVVNGVSAEVLRLEQPDGSWGLTLEKGKRFDVLVENLTSEPTSIHWHGLILPWRQDGVAYVTQPAIPPGGRYRYSFPILQAGTYWMHSHYGLQEQRLLAAPLILSDPREAQQGMREAVMFLSDWSNRSPLDIWRGLKKGGRMGGMSGMGGAMPGHGAMGGMAGMPQHGGHGTGGMPGMPGMPAMAPGGVDLNDVDYDAYLTNWRTLSDPEVVRVEPGSTLRLRIINGAAASNFIVSTGAVAAEVIATDGEPVVPLQANRFQMAIAQRLDLRLTIPPGEGVYPILAQGEGTTKQTGLVLATPKASPSPIAEVAGAPAPALDYAQERLLKASAPLARRTVDRSITVGLDGDMMRYVWSINGETWPRVTPLRVKHGERIELVFDNKTAMAHPMHLHGHVFEVTELGGAPVSGPKRDTVLVLSRSTAKVQFDADNPGIWMIHCHVLYHLLAGMMTTLNYEGVAPLFSVEDQLASHEIPEN
ncbi:MAG: multicopper oxidase family protein [Alphaproteobacteria bacterium]